MHYQIRDTLHYLDQHPSRRARWRVMCTSRAHTAIRSGIVEAVHRLPAYRSGIIKGLIYRSFRICRHAGRLLVRCTCVCITYVYTYDTVHVYSHRAHATAIYGAETLVVSPPYVVDVPATIFISVTVTLWKWEPFEEYLSLSLSLFLSVALAMPREYISIYLHVHIIVRNNCNNFLNKFCISF